MVEGNLNFILDLSSGDAFSDIQIVFMCHIAKLLAIKTIKTPNKSRTVIICFEATFRNEH